MDSKIKILDLKNNYIAPFEIEDMRLTKLFSFFLHLAPSISSETSIKVDESKLEERFHSWLNEWEEGTYRIYSDSTKIEIKLEKYALNDDRLLKRNSRGFLCNKHGGETDSRCFLRHIRNSIAHSTVYIMISRRRKYIMFEDYNRRKNLTAIILMSQTDLTKLKKAVVK